MLEFYLFPEWARITVSCGLAICCLIQTASLMLGCYSYRTGRAFTIGNIYEGVVLLQVLSLLLLFSQVQLNVMDGFFVAQDYAAVQYVLFAMLTLTAVLLCFLRRSAWPLVPVAAAALTLPEAASAAGRAFPALFCSALMLLLLRASVLSVIRRRKIKNSISVLSIKEAVDKLHTGLLFYQQDGSIILVNRRMEKLMLEIGGRVFQDGREFRYLLVDGPCRHGCVSEVLESNRVFRLSNGTVWLFSISEMLVKYSLCFELTASDVTSQWRAAEKLREQNGELTQKGAALKETFQNLRAIARQEERLTAKTRVHDVLGQRLTLLLRALREGAEPDETVLTEFIDGLPGELKKTEAEIPASANLELLRETMSYIGVTVTWEGTPPDDESAARLFAGICTETATNAVRHGLATAVSFRFGREPGKFSLTVTDDGKGAPAPVKEGGGLQGIREKLAMAGGSLTVEPEPSFTVKAIIPGGEKI